MIHSVEIVNKRFCTVLPLHSASVHYLGHAKHAYFRNFGLLLAVYLQTAYFIFMLEHYYHEDTWEAISDMIAAGPSGKAGVSSILLSAPGFDDDFVLWAGPVFTMLQAGIKAIQAEEMTAVVCFHPKCKLIPCIIVVEWAISFLSILGDEIRRNAPKAFHTLPSVGLLF